MARRGRGRPPFKVTATARRQVAELISCGMTQADVARAIGCHLETLQKHFPEELATGASRKRAEVLAMLYKNARKGNVSAQKHLEAMTRAAAAAEAVGKRGDQVEADAPAPAKLGKKEQLQQAAEKVGGKFAPPEPPKLVVNNG